ncbi:MAG TPA: VOC family protein [Solirubrobacteraceae bacterium]|jgi:lactoylglutathione lyase|nr:VOC family protein [Solirubrobacteraceae bacterium]
MSIRPYCLHHVNFPTSDMDRSQAWYEQVFGMARVDVSRVSDTPVLLMTFGNFDLHFTPHPNPPDMKPHHFCVEVQDWDAMHTGLDELGIRPTKPVYRLQNDSRACYIHDPDGNLVELIHHSAWDHSVEPSGRAKATYKTKV